MACFAPLIALTTSAMSAGRFSFFVALERSFGVFGENQLVSAPSAPSLIVLLVPSKVRSTAPCSFFGSVWDCAVSAFSCFQ